MAAFNARQLIEKAEVDLEMAKHAYLLRFGWDFTCNTPGSYWLWRRDFAKDDAERHRRWKEGGPGPLGWPSEPRPYGVITADLDLAISITRRALDREIDQDGNPETPTCTEADELV